jgi:dihydrodipicolinate synthase/N-acetylneuraminate lyase
LWTPLTEEGVVDEAALDVHLEWLESKGLSGFLVLGSTGRFAGMPVAEREGLAGHVLKRVRRLPVLVNISHLDQRKVNRLGRHAREQGAAGVAVLPPWYYEQAQADLVEWFVAAGEAADLPLWLYSFPERTGNRIDVGTVREVVSRRPVAGFKASGSSQGLLRELARLAESRPFALFAGADTQIPEVLEQGAVGCIGGLVNALPEAMLAVYEACKAGRPEGAGRELALLRELGRRLQLVPSPFGVAAVMEARGLNPGVLPPMMSRVTRAHYEQLKSEVRGLLEEFAG